MWGLKRSWCSLVFVSSLYIYSTQALKHELINVLFRVLKRKSINSINIELVITLARMKDGINKIRLNPTFRPDSYNFAHHPVAEGIFSNYLEFIRCRRRQSIDG